MGAMLASTVAAQDAARTTAEGVQRLQELEVSERRYQACSESPQVLAAAVVLQVIVCIVVSRPASRLSHFCADVQEAEQAHAARDAKAEQKAAGAHDAEQLAVAAGQARLERAACMLASLQEAVAAVQAATMAEVSPVCEQEFLHLCSLR